MFAEPELNNIKTIGFIADKNMCESINRLLRDRHRAYNEDFLKEDRRIFDGGEEFATIISRMRLA